MKKFRILFLICLSLLLFSCEDSSNSPYVDEYPDSSSLKVTFNERSVLTTSAVYQMDFNKDDTSISTGNYVLELKHTYEGKECAYSWKFQSGDLRFNNVTENSCSIDVTQFKALGTYTVKAISELSEDDKSFDKTFIINVTSDLSEIAIDYQIQNAYKKSNLTYTDEMVSGTITRFTKELTLAAGAVYDFVVRDTSENHLPITNIVASKTNDNIGFREIYDNTAELVCQQKDNVSTYFTIRVGSSSIALTCKVNLEDISNSILSEVDITQDTESIISLVANTAEDPDKAYTYQIKTNSVLENRILKFSIDYEDWSRETEESYVENPNMTVKKSDTVNWLQHSALTRTFETKELFRIEVDGVTGSFSIVPVNDTIFSSSKFSGERNLHCYLYVRYAEDEPSDFPRYRWRIMIGGKLEGLQLCTVDANNGQETIVENDIAIREGDETGWIFRAKYIPATSENNKTLWYLATSKNAVLWNNGVNSFYAPVPVEKNDSSNKVINMMEGKNTTYTELDDYKYNSKPFYAHYFFYEEAEDGYSDLWTTYNSIGKDVVVVALNVETKHYCCVGIKDLGDKQIIVKGLSQAPIYYKGISTGYTSEDYGQSFPKTVVTDYEQYRTFYMDVNETLKLTVDSSFKMENLDAYGDSSARDIFPYLSADLDLEGLSGTVKLQTYYAAVKDQGYKKEDYLTDGVTVYVKVNNKYSILLRIVVYDKESL